MQYIDKSNIFALQNVLRYKGISGTIFSEDYLRIQPISDFLLAKLSKNYVPVVIKAKTVKKNTTKVYS